jgi:hypothetical protein
MNSAFKRETSAKKYPNGQESSMAAHPTNPPKFKIGERVEVCGILRSVTGTVIDVDWIYHYRMGEYTWGYLCKFDNNENPPTTYNYTPEGYISALPEHQEDPNKEPSNRVSYISVLMGQAVLVQISTVLPIS